MPPTRVALLITAGSIVGALMVAPQAQANGCVFSDFGGGNGTTEPLIVNTSTHLSRLQGDSRCWGYTFEQTADISMGGATWSTGIGTAATAFSGTYDGGGYKISDLTISGSEARLALFGNSTGTISNLGFTGTVAGSGTYVAGLVGFQSGGSITNSYTTGTVTRTGDGDADVGGLVGYNNGTVTGSFATGNVSLNGNATTVAVGGLVGNQDSTVSSSFATGSVSVSGTQTNTRVGGLLGHLRGGLTNSYSTGAVTPSTGTYAGGLIGQHTIESPNESGSFWDTQTSGLNSSAAGTGKTTEEMKTLSTFTGWSISNGWDSSSTWGMCSSVNSGYPFLTAFHSSNPCSSGSGSAFNDTETLELAPEPGLNCASSESGRRGTWISLPSASQCTLSGDYSGTLLGWSTLRDFPLDIAQRQVDNGWGAYELFDESGRMLGVFIPAGGATFVSNSTRLYPIINPTIG